MLLRFMALDGRLLISPCGASTDRLAFIVARGPLAAAGGSNDAARAVAVERVLTAVHARASSGFARKAAAKRDEQASDVDAQ